VIPTGSPADRFGYGGAYYHKAFLLDEHDPLTAYSGD
jgi:hypothetical protein